MSKATLLSPAETSAMIWLLHKVMQHSNEQILDLQTGIDDSIYEESLENELAQSELATMIRMSREFLVKIDPTFNSNSETLKSSIS